MPLNPASAGPAPEIPDLKKPDLQMLMQDNAAARREVYEARRETQKRVDEERERSRYEIDRIRVEAAERQRKSDRENDALIVALGRLREENDELRHENLILKVARNGSAADLKEPETRPSPLPGYSAVGPIGSGPKVPVMPLPGPMLGKAVPVDPMKL